MSIQLPVRFFKGEEQVHYTTTPGGYTHVTLTDDELIADVLETVEFLGPWLAKYGKPPFPEWDKFRIQVGDRTIEHVA